MQTRPEDVMPWKINGERWHLSDKGFPPGKVLRWDRSLLPRLLTLVREIDPNLEIRWDTRDTITFYAKGKTRLWSQWRTKDAKGLICKFVGPKGQFNLGQVEKFGKDPHIDSDREGADVIELMFQHADHLHPTELKQLLTEHLKGFVAASF
jgi:excinuclease ABC subunit A